MKSQIIVVGAGGHAKVCIELLKAMGESIAYCVGAHDGPDACLGISVLHGDRHLRELREQGYSKLFIALGSNHLRKNLADAGLKLGYELVNAISPAAVVSHSAKLGTGVAIMAGVVINADSVISDLAIINTGSTIDHDCQVGIAAHIGPQCALAGNVSVGYQSFLGIGCKVIPKIQIGEKVIIGAGGVVINDIPSNTTAVGIPARPILA